MKTFFSLTPGELTLEHTHHLLTHDIHIKINESAWHAIDESEQFIKHIIAEDKTVYGVNTGFGLLANTKIKPHELEILQRHILLSHAAGVGELIPDEMTKLILLLKINSLARGYSGVRRQIIETLIQFYNHGLYPCIPCKGSVGASGDLAPLAHLALPLIGEGSVRYQGKIISGKQALKHILQPPLTLAAKEGLALLNGTQVSCGIALYHLFQAQDLLNAAIVIGALTVDAAQGSLTPFNPLIHKVRGHVGQIVVAKKLSHFLTNSNIMDAHKHCATVQDPYCLRCQPQVLGACLDSLKHVVSVLAIEANAVSDNPLVFAEKGLVLSGGNFHAEPVAQVADLLAIALSEIGAIAERRIALLVDPHFNKGLPAFLAPQPGLNSGFMVAHVTAASLASANKSLAHPFSVDSIPTSANQEDHVSMATYAAWRLKDMIENVRYILAIELLAACQGIELRRPLKSSDSLEDIITLVRKHVKFFQEDRYFAPDINAASELVVEIARQQAAVLWDTPAN
ncbi:MAG: histidine ammonia-lyase [Gammaproteobacteria bacterium]|nr:histidine ammonia-lyase [Gammaproteobacteria bacterium]